MNGNNVERLYNGPILQTDVVKLYSKDIIKYNWNDGQGQKYTNTHTKIVVDKSIYKKKKYNCMGVNESKGLFPYFINEILSE